METLLETATKKQGQWKTLMAQVRKNSESGPWTIVASTSKGVVDQAFVKLQELIPAQYEETAKKNPSTKITIEDATGKIVFSKDIK